MNILLSGEHGEAEASSRFPAIAKSAGDDLLLYSLEVTGAGGYWVEFSRRADSRQTQPTNAEHGGRLSTGAGICAQIDAAGELAYNVHRAVAENSPSTALRSAISPATASA